MQDSADMYEVYRRLSGNPPDVTAVTGLKPLRTEYLKLSPGMVLPCEDPQAVRFHHVPWFRVPVRAS